MQHTAYSVLTDEELVLYTHSKPDLTPLERELVQRFVVVLDALSELTDDPGSEGQGSC